MAKLEITYRQKWVRAIDLCLKQKRYGGDMGSCMLCRVAVFECSNCVCYEYLRYIGVGGNYGQQPCVNILQNVKKPGSYNPEKANIIWEKAWVRHNLNRMMEWLTGGERERRGL